VTERACLVAVYRELLVVQHQLAEQLDLLDLIIRRLGKPLDRPRLDAVYLGLELRNLLQRRGRQRCAALRRGWRVCAHGGGNEGRRNRQNRARCLAHGWISTWHRVPHCRNRHLVRDRLVHFNFQ
jgi:hypothetical protein